MKQINAIIIDDEAGCVETLLLLLQNYHPYVNIIGTANSINEGLNIIRKNKDKLDLLFLDIQMPGGDGFTLLQHIQEISFKIIFTTAYDMYAIRAIKFSALDYLLKPIDNSELEMALVRLQSEGPEHQNKRMSHFREQFQYKGTFDRMAVSTMNDIVMIELNKIIYLESNNNYTTLHIEGDRLLVSSKNVGYYEDLLSMSCFFRIHNSYLINIKRMTRYIKGGAGQVEMDSGIKLPVSTRRKEDFLKRLASV
jgi:two-component system, LytTR family, response regulator